MAKYLDSVGLTHLVSKLKSDVIPNVKVSNAGTADKANYVHASKIDGVIDISHIPQGALERVVTVADDTARLKLTTGSVQLGDTVKVTSTGRMYIVIDESKLTSEAGYMEYTAGSAASVPWSGVTGKPSTYAPSSHNHTASVKIGKADSKSVSTSAKLSLSVADILGTAPTTSGSGNAITAISISGDVITATKGSTFAVASDVNTAINGVKGRLDNLEAFTGSSASGGLADQLNTLGYDIVPFNGLLSAAPTASQNSLAKDADGLAIYGTTASDGTITVGGIYAIEQSSMSAQKTYYSNWKDCLKATPDTTSPKVKLHRHKIYLDLTTGKAYYAYSDTQLKEIDGGDKALTDTEIDAAVTAAK